MNVPTPEEEGLETPVFDPIDLLPTGTIASLFSKYLLKSGAKEITEAGITKAAEGVKKEIFKMTDELSPEIIETIKNITPDTMLDIFHGWVRTKVPPMVDETLTVLPRGTFRVSPAMTTSQRVGEKSGGGLMQLKVPAGKLLPSDESAKVSDDFLKGLFPSSSNPRLSYSLLSYGEPQAILSAGQYPFKNLTGGLMGR